MGTQIAFYSASDIGMLIKMSIDLKNLIGLFLITMLVAACGAQESSSGDQSADMSVSPFVDFENNAGDNQMIINMSLVQCFDDIFEYDPETTMWDVDTAGSELTDECIRGCDLLLSTHDFDKIIIQMLIESDFLDNFADEYHLQIAQINVINSVVLLCHAFGWEAGRCVEVVTIACGRGTQSR